jgi:hypothetical protein
MVRHPLKEKYWKQKSHAKRRGIEFNLPLQEWLDWWGKDLDARGRGLGKLQMCRFEDKGAYELGNIFKGTHEQNMRDKKRNGTHKARPKILDKEQVEEILYALFYAKMSTRAVAKAMCVSQRTVMRVKHEQGAYAD